MKYDELKINGMHMNASPSVFRKAELLRKSMTVQEKMLWEYLKMKPHGYKFRRQHPISAYILDFYSHGFRLALEIDGQNHNAKEQIEYDLQRTEYLESLGIKEVRFKNDEVINNLPLVIQKIEAILSEQPSLNVRASEDNEYNKFDIR